MRRPALKDDEFLVFDVALYLGQHALLARFHHFPALETERRIVNRIQHQLVRAGLDAIHLVVELVGKFLQIGKILDAGVIRHRKERQRCIWRRSDWSLSFRQSRHP